MKKALIVTNWNHPFSKTGSFFSNELPYLKKGFTKIIFIYLNDDEIGKQEIKGIKTLQYKMKLTPVKLNIQRILALFSKDFWKEVNDIKKRYNKKITLSRLNILLVDIVKGKLLEKFILNNIQIEFNDSEWKFYLYSYWFDYSLYALIRCKSKLKNAVVVSRAHRFDFYFEFAWKQYLPLKRTCYERIDKIFFVSGKGLKYFKGKLNLVNNQKMIVSKLGTSNNLQRSIPSNNGTFQLVSCSFVTPVKRINLIIEALSEINSIKISWSHIGDGIDLHRLTEMAHNMLDSNNNINFEFIGYKNINEIYQLYANRPIDAFINVSEIEGIPVSMMEAFSSGIPIIATNVGGVNEIVTSKNGVLLSENPTTSDIISAINKIQKLSNDETKTIRDNAYDTWENYYNSEKNYTSFINLLTNI